MKTKYFVALSIFLIISTSCSKTVLYNQEHIHFSQNLSQINTDSESLKQCLLFLHDYVKTHEKTLESSDLFNLGLDQDMLMIASILEQTNNALNRATRDMFCQRIILRREHNRIQDSLFQQYSNIPNNNG